jgi:hypothetical protein
MEKVYCIVDLTVDPDVAIDGLVDLTHSEALAWLEENNSENKYEARPHNWIVEDATSETSPAE